MKKIISVILLLAIISSMIIFPVSAATPETTDLADTCPCGCGLALESVDWKPWNVNEDASVTSGHYYLEGNYVQTQQATITSGNRVVLDLRGYKVTINNSRLILCYGQMAVMDSVGGGRLCGNTTGSGYGGVVMVSTYETLGSSFALYSGTITVDENHNGSRRGGLISVADTCSFRMYGGTVLNGTTYSLLEDYKDTRDDAGCIYGASGSSIEILGGSVIGGKSDRYGGNIYSQGTTVLKNCEIIGGEAESSGGNVCQNGGSLTVENATISNGVCSGTSNGGGNICLMTGAVLNIKNSTIRNGYSAYHGGNIYMGTASGIIENTVIEAGTAGMRGNNIYGSSAVTALTVKNCEIPGDVAFIGKGLNLEGKVKIGLLGNGLKLWYGSTVGTVSGAGLTEGSEIYIDYTGTVEGADPAYFKGALRTVLTESENGLVATQAASGEPGGYCAHCGQQVTWKAYSTTDSLVQNCLLDSATDADPACTARHIASGHYYMESSLTGAAQYYIGAYLSGSGTLRTEDVVIDLNGCDITASHRVFYLRPKDADGNANKLTLMDSVGGSTLTGSGAANQGGGVLYNEGGELNIYGGEYVYKPVEGRNVTNGGVILNGGKLQLHGGILNGSAYTFTDASTEEKTYTYYGGAIYMGAGASRTLTMTAGKIFGGEANQGGGLYCSYNTVIDITGGQFTGGRAITNGSVLGCGGNIRAEGNSTNKYGKLNISGCSLTYGYAQSNAGNFSATYFAEINLGDSYIADGSTGDYGGNIAIGTGSVFANYENLIVNKGTAVRGANLYCAGTGARANIVSCYVTDGVASGYGGNFYAGNGYLVVKGGVFAYGIAGGTYGGNFVANAGKTSAANYLTFQADDNGNAPMIVGGKATTYGGNLYVNGVLNMESAFVHNGTAAADKGQDIWYTATSSSHKAHKLTIGSGVTGEIVMGSATGNFTDPVYGMPIADTVCSALNCSITLENLENTPVSAKDGTLYVSSVAVFNAAGESRWYATNADAIAACGEQEYVKLYTDDPVVLTRDCAIDLNGHTVNVSGAYTLSGMDSASQGGTDSTGKAIVSEETTYIADYKAPDGFRYLAVQNGTDLTFHCLDMRITSVNLRPGTAGVYYSAAWNLDSTLKAQIQSFGIAVSTLMMPTAQFGEDVLYTQMTADQLVCGTVIPGAIVDNILSENASFEMDGSQFEGSDANMLRGQKQIFATPYVVLTDGTHLVGDDSTTDTDDVALSLRDVLTQIGRLVDTNPEQYRRYTPTLRAFHTAWKGATEKWDLGDMYAFATPEEDDVMDVLMIGNSYNYYYVEELHEMAKAAGVKMRVCNLYYSGCPMNNHLNWWRSGAKKYQYFEAVDGGKTKVDGVSLEWALQQHQWDVLTFQMSSSEMRKYTVEESLAIHREPRNVLFGYFEEQFPDAKLYFQQNWSYEIGHTRDDGYVMKDLEQQIAYTEHIRQIVTGICAENGVDRINTGDAWELYRAACDEAGIAHNLCARLGKNTLTGEAHSGDGTHDGDIGGGQLLNAAVWFEILTGKDCRETGYAPVYTYGGETYTLSDTMVEMLYDAAHKAVNEILPTYPENA